MSKSLRFNALDTILYREKKVVNTPSTRISEYFGSHVFTRKVMQQYLSAKLYKQFVKTIDSGKSLDRDLADHIADAMYNWAISMGVTHYAHWFQPLTGRTAEKHDSFFTLDDDGSPIEKFSGDALVQQEPDGSSFPGGGLRTTFEARGYTAWDTTSPAFVLEVENEKTLCIPTIFVTYGGQSLDYKLPLLKSVSYLENAAVKVCQLFDENINKVYATLGWEQEYFLIDEALFNARPDLQFTGRTVLGSRAPKGQQMEDNYFGSITERVYAYMRDLEVECHKLGIPVRTRHNEVAPSQYELAPQYEELNVAVDHNQLLMDLMDRVARRHKLAVLLHEKPFAGVNGSGKHNNWSLATNTGVNLLSPGSDPSNNLLFLTFFVNAIQAVHNYGDLLRASIASANNDHRLGANEAPPAIMSVFIGDAMTRTIEALASDSNAGNTAKEAYQLTNMVPELEKDNTDRNRTSPFAFTGNKFEIRMVGSSSNCAGPMTVMNMIMGKQLNDFYNEVNALIDSGKDKKIAVETILKRYITENRKVRFEGDNYSNAWKIEAKSRGLNNFQTTPEALAAFVEEKSELLFTESGVLSVEELHAHYDVKLESYSLQIQIESRILAEICLNQIIPVSVRYQTELANNILSLQDLGLDEESYAAQLEMVKQLGSHINALKSLINKMRDERAAANEFGSKEKAFAYNDKVKPVMELIREHAEELEDLVDDSEWPVAKYRELLFLK